MGLILATWYAALYMEMRSVGNTQQIDSVEYSEPGLKFDPPIVWLIYLLANRF